MTTRTLDVEIDEMLMMALLLGQLVDNQQAVLREPTTTEDQADQARTRIEIALRLRGKLPLHIDYGEPDDDE